MERNKSQLKLRKSVCHVETHISKQVYTPHRLVLYKASTTAPLLGVNSYLLTLGHEHGYLLIE